MGECYIRRGANFRGRHTRGVEANSYVKYRGVKSFDRGSLVVAGKPLTINPLAVVVAQ